MYKKNKVSIEKYKNIFFSVSCLVVLSVLMFITGKSPEKFQSTQTVAPLQIYDEKKEVNKIEVMFCCLDLENNKLIETKQKINLDKYLQNPEKTLIEEYFNYIGDGKVVSPLCNKVKVDKAVIEDGTLKIDLLEVGESKYNNEIIKKVSEFSNDLKKLAVAETLKQLKNVEGYEVTLNGDELEILSYISKVASN